jgi:IS30 family transposase
VGRRGPAPDTEKRGRFARLIALGVPNAEACRKVGINRKTGTRWRLGRTISSGNGRKLHYRPVVNPRSTEISPRYLSEDERVRIADLRQQGLSMRAVAAALGRDPATISRELRRNADPGSGKYRPFAAHRMAVERRPRLRTGKLARDSELREFVEGRLKKRWSPEQISQRLRVEFPDEPDRHLVHETIYQAIYRADLGGLSRELPPPRLLRSRRRRRKPHRKPDARRRGVLTDMTMIDQRPVEVEGRTEPGHWESQ